jgi:hypothetical protein
MQSNYGQFLTMPVHGKKNYEKLQDKPSPGQD